MSMELSGMRNIFLIDNKRLWRFTASQFGISG